MEISDTCVIEPWKPWENARSQWQHLCEYTKVLIREQPTSLCLNTKKLSELNLPQDTSTENERKHKLLNTILTIDCMLIKIKLQNNACNSLKMLVMAENLCELQLGPFYYFIISMVCEREVKNKNVCKHK